MNSKSEELKLFSSSIIPKTIKHAFFTRNGGMSGGDFASLNFTMKFGDKREIIQENKNIVVNFFAINPQQLKILNQVHSAKVIEVTDNKQEVETIEADALVTKLPGIILGVVTADCVPILLCDPEAQIIATIHAGWRGALQGVIQNTVQHMCAIGGKVNRICAVIGPAIQQASYEVDEEFYKSFLAQDAINTKYFLSGKTPDKYMFNLPAYCHYQLMSLGIIKLDNLELNTYTNPDLFLVAEDRRIKGNNLVVNYLQ